MTSQSKTERSTFAMRPEHINGEPDGAWWPQSRRFEDELGGLLDLWPKSAGTITRIFYSPPDWDDHPYAVITRGRRFNTGSFPHDDSHELTMSLLGGERRRLTVIPPQTSAAEAERILADMRAEPAAPSPLGGDDEERDNEGEG